MDAKARRLLWNDIISLIKENRIVILTSHSMEECEALCTRLVIMVNGQFKCLGSSQHLKSKFGNGYKLSIRLNNENECENLFNFMRKNFPTCVMQETHRNLFEYILSFKDARLSDIFGKIEKNRDSLNIKDYSVSQTTLDQVFINFAKQQNEEPFTDTPTSPLTKSSSTQNLEKGISLQPYSVSPRKPIASENDDFNLIFDRKSNEYFTPDPNNNNIPTSQRKMSLGTRLSGEFGFNIMPKSVDLNNGPKTYEITHL